MNKCLWVITMVLFTASALSAQLYQGEEGLARFRSDAPLELIEAESERLRCVINAKDGSFAFRVRITSFDGFNSRLQREHFNENYLESGSFPEATFRGSIIEQVDLSQNGEYRVRAKGSLVIHGVAQERIIKSTIRVSGGKLEVVSRFTVRLSEHDIQVPRIVNQKIASEIEVTVRAELLPRS